MIEKKEYASPELELVKLTISSDVLAISDPMSAVSEGSGGGLGPGDDPWGEQLTP